MTKLKDICDYVVEKIDISEIDKKQYIANDNMLKEKKGIKEADIFPDNGKVTKFKTGDILIGNIRPYFKKIWKATFDGGCSQDVLVFRNKDEFSSNYLYSILATDSFFKYVMLAPKGSKMPRGDKEHIMRYEFEHDKDIQLTGDYIYSITQKIENNEILLNKYNQIMEVNYKDFFYNNLDECVVYDERINRKIPENWNIFDFNHIPNTSVIKTGVEFFEEKNYLATANIVDETINDGNYVTYEKRENRANMQPCLNSIWFAKMKDSLKRTCITKSGQWIVDKYILSTGFVGIKCDDAIMSYLYNYLLFDDFEIIKNKLAHGDTQQAINGTDLDNIYIPIPDNDSLNEFNNIIYPILEIKNNIIYENQKLYEMRELILNQFM